MVKISKTSIRSLERYIEQFNKDEEVLIVYPFSNFQQIERAGFKSTSMIGRRYSPYNYWESYQRKRQREIHLF